MLWARVVRGMSSMENDVTPVAASFWSVSIFPKGRRKPTRVWSGMKERQVRFTGFGWAGA